MAQKKSTKAIEKIKDIGMMSLLWFLIFVLLFIFFLGLFSCLSEFGVLDIKIGLLIALGASVGLTAIAFITNLILQKKLSARYEFKLKIYFQKYGHIFFAVALFLMLAFISFKHELLMDIEGAKSLLTIEWVIFGLSITIFLFWNAGIIKYLERQKPKNDVSVEDPKQMIASILERTDFNFNANYKFVAVVLLIVNLLSLLLSTSIVYLPPIRWGVLWQNVLVFTFFVTTNTISTLLLDIVRIVFEEKRELQKATQVTNIEVSAADTYLFIFGVIKNAFEKVDKQKGL